MKKRETAFQLIFWCVLIILSWIGAWRISLSSVIVTKPLTLADQATILFGAASIALFILSLMIAVVAVIGWQTIKDHIRQEVEVAMEKKTDILARELRGRVVSLFGHTLGMLSTDPGRLEPLDENRLREAVRHCQDGYELLEKVAGPAEFMALNNLVYYSSVLGDSSHSRHLLEKARLLREAGQRHHAPHLLLTYCRAVLQFSDDSKEIKEARDIAAAMAKPMSEVSQQQRNEASFYLASFDTSQQALPRVSTT